MTTWDKLKNYINDKSIGDIIHRKELLQYNITPPMPGTHGTTVDKYRRCLELIGILEKHKLGQYKILYHIKDTVSLSFIKKIAYSRSYRQWFNDIKVEE